LAHLSQKPLKALDKDVIMGGFGNSDVEFYVLVQVGTLEGDLLFHRLCRALNDG